MLIAEIGNCHFGNFEEAKLMIIAAKEFGADAVKGQAFLARDVSQFGSMPKEFYEKCQFSFDQYEELIYYAREFVGIEMFYSIFSQEMEPLSFHQEFHKISGGQVKGGLGDPEKKDTDRTFVSISKSSRLPKLRRARIGFVGKYLEEKPNLRHIDFLGTYYKRPIGYSDHSKGVDACLMAIEEFDVPWIEKHITLQPNRKFKGRTFRDNEHSALPIELEKIAKRMNK